MDSSENTPYQIFVLRNGVYEYDEVVMGIHCNDAGLVWRQAEYPSRRAASIIVVGKSLHDDKRIMSAYGPRHAVVPLPDEDV